MKDRFTVSDGDIKDKIVGSKIVDVEHTYTWYDTHLNILLDNGQRIKIEARELSGMPRFKLEVLESRKD
jgi:c-di-GMP-binding flagellar brake protein YcgR